MSRLIKGMFGSEFDPAKDTLFGLRCGQMRGREICHNAGWYNTAGEKLGWGDLHSDDFQRISSELEDGELFIVLGESDSFWEFVTRPGLIGSMSAVKPDVQAPGVEYVAEKCYVIIAPEQVFYVSRYGDRVGETIDFRGIPATVVNRDEAKTLVAGVCTA